jgi:vanillate O-demethylase monooxygenase subunit
MFPKNVWYMAGWSEELGDRLLARRLFDRPIVMFRQSDGGIAALADRCPHRFAPLSLGKQESDTLVCGYHGLTFDGTGSCVRNPFSDKIPAAAKVQSRAGKCCAAIPCSKRPMSSVPTI